MANITKRAAKKLAQYLEPGESIDVAVLMEPRGTYGPGMVALALAPRTADRALSDRADAAGDEQGGRAAAFPSKSCVLAVSDRRIVVSPSNGLTFGAPAMVLQRGQITVGDVKNKGLGRRMQLVFDDASTVEVDLQRGQPVDKLRAKLSGA